MFYGRLDSVSGNWTNLFRMYLKPCTTYTSQRNANCKVYNLIEAVYEHKRGCRQMDLLHDLHLDPHKKTC
jgi:hypothetical protein